MPWLALPILLLAAAGDTASPLSPSLLSPSGRSTALVGTVISVTTSEYEFLPGKQKPFSDVLVAVDSIIGAGPGVPARAETVRYISHNAIFVDTASGGLRVQEIDGTPWFKVGDHAVIIGKLFMPSNDVPSQKDLGDRVVAQQGWYLQNGSEDGDPWALVEQSTSFDEALRNRDNYTPDGWSAHLRRKVVPSPYRLRGLIAAIQRKDKEIKSRLNQGR